MRVLVCGGRNYVGDVSCLSQLDITILIHGAANGADKRAGQWAKQNKIHVAEVPALWGSIGASQAGYMRNKAMLLLQPQYCVAFPGGRGTANMIKLCIEAGIVVWQPYG